MAETGRAAVFTGVREPFDLREYPVPDPGERSVVVKIERTNICGSDLHLWGGDTNLAAMGLTYGMILGHEMTGRVHRLGKKVRTDAVGKRVREGDPIAFSYYVPCGRCQGCLKGCPHLCLASLASPVRSCEEPPHFVGGFADYYVLEPRQSFFVRPKGASAKLVASANCALSQVIHGLAEVRLKLGETVVIQGCGGLGLYACAVAKHMGARTVIAIDAIGARLEMARAFGADEVIDVSETSDRRARVSKVWDLTEDWGADVVVELVGTPDVVNEGIRMLARGGRYLELGNINPKKTYQADPSLLVGFNRSIVGVSLYPQPVLKQAVEFLVANRERYPFEQLLSHDYALEDIDRAFQEADEKKLPILRASIVLDEASA